MKEIDCDSVEERDLVVRYLGGRLPEAEAEAFEVHYFGCERCWGEVRGAAEIRAAHGLPVLAAPSQVKRDKGRDVWTLLAAAAAVALMVVGLRQLVQRSEVSPQEAVWRGSSAGDLPVEITQGAPRQVVLRWQPHPEAQVYVVEIFAPDGASVWRRETAETTVSLDGEALTPRSTGISFLATVEALDTMRRVVAKSEPKRLPRP